MQSQLGEKATGDLLLLSPVFQGYNLRFRADSFKGQIAVLIVQIVILRISVNRTYCRIIHCVAIFPVFNVNHPPNNRGQALKLRL